MSQCVMVGCEREVTLPGFCIQCIEQDVPGLEADCQEVASR